MRFGLFQKISNAKLFYLKRKFQFYKFLYGFDTAIKILYTAPKFACIPLLKLAKAKIGDNCDIETPLYFHNCNDLSKLTIGNNCHIGKNCFFDLRGQVIIGNNVVVSMQSTFITHIDMTKSNLSLLYPSKSGDIKIEDNCYLGVGITILMGVIVRDNSFITAKALVNKEVLPNTMVGGIPAKKIKDLN